MLTIKCKSCVFFRDPDTCVINEDPYIPKDGLFPSGFCDFHRIPYEVKEMIIDEINRENENGV